MRRFKRASRPKPSLALMIVPMIDIIFLLLLFFTMVTSFEAGTRIRIDVPNPEESQAHRSESARRVVINCEYVVPTASAGESVLYRMGPDPPEPLSAISERLKAAAAHTGPIAVVIRADRRLPFEQVQAVMRVVAENGIEDMKVSALLEMGT